MNHLARDLHPRLIKSGSATAINSSNVRELETFQISLGSGIVSYEVGSGFCDVITFIGQVFVCSVSS